MIYSCRYLFSQLNDYSASRDIIWLCGDLAETLQKVSYREMEPVFQYFGYLEDFHYLSNFKKWLSVQEF